MLVLGGDLSGRAHLLRLFTVVGETSSHAVKDGTGHVYRALTCGTHRVVSITFLVSMFRLSVMLESGQVASQRWSGTSSDTNWLATQVLRLLRTH